MFCSRESTYCLVIGMIWRDLEGAEEKVDTEVEMGITLEIEVRTKVVIVVQSQDILGGSAKTRKMIKPNKENKGHKCNRLLNSRKKLVRFLARNDARESQRSDRYGRSI